MVENQIYIGTSNQTLVCFDSASIRSLTITEECSITGEELPADLVEAEVQYEYDDGAFTWDTYPAGTSVLVYRDGVLYGKYYLESIKQNEGQVYTIRAQSVIWMLSSVHHNGAHTTANAKSCLGMILNNQAYRTLASYELYVRTEVDPQLSNEMMQLSFTPCTMREALQAFLFANRLRLVRVGLKYVLSRLSYTISSEIPPDAEYTGGTVERPDRVASITVHGYEYSSENVWASVEVDNPYDQEIIVDLDFPTSRVKDSKTDPECGVTLVKFLSAFRLVVTGSGIIKVETPRVVETEYTQGSKTANGTHYDIDNRMITSTNAEALVQDLWNYYNAREDIKIDTVDAGERCGNLYTCESPFGTGKVSGYLAKNVITASGVNKGQKTLVSKFNPVKSGYTRSMVVTTSGSVTLPDEIFSQENPSIRVILVGGGTGGSSGYAGAAGGAPQSWTGVSGGSGGAAGANGAGGKAYSVTISGSSLQRSYNVTIGEGGAGGAQCSSTESNNAGQAGGNTTFGSYSSASGSSSSEGTVDPITKKQYGATPTSVYCGSAGATGGSLVNEHDDYLAWNLGEKCPAWYFDGKGIPFIVTGQGGLCQDGRKDGECVFYSGSSGGGAAFYSSGKYGSPGNVSGTSVWAPSGGDGADAYEQSDSDKLIEYNAWMNYGYGGLGGHGGGGGGAGAAFGPYLDAWGYSKANTPAGGRGGKGGKGGKGAQGCVIILY